MAWIKFTEDFNFRPRASTTTAYKAGMVMNVTSQCAALAIAANKAVRMSKPSRDADPIAAAQGETAPVVAEGE